jgi:branched-chain amino acid transport system ATP-binding protein
MTLLECRGLTKRFGALTAVQGVSLHLERGEILGLIGPNGSGKTTLFNVIVGLYAPDEGDVFFRGKRVTGRPPHEICHLGIAKTSQILQPFGEMTVFENLLVAALYGKNLSMRLARRRAEEVGDFVGLTDLRMEPAGTIAVACRRRLELGRALATGAELLLLDEVLAGLNPTEIEEALDLVLRIRAEGVTLILVEHVMRAIMGISDRLVVLNYGEKIAEGTPREIAGNEEVITAYLGKRYA